MKSWTRLEEVTHGRLYHYEKFCPSWLETTLRARKVYCSDPSALNDPWDCKPWFVAGVGELDRSTLSQQVHEEIAKRRIYCLSTDPLSSLMWSHYTANHTGICLEFHIGNKLFLKAAKVRYRVEYPVIDPTEMFTDLAVKKMLLTKAWHWKYEREYRLLASPELPLINPLRLHAGYLKLPSRALLAVLVGCNGDYDAVKEIVEKHSPSTRVIRIIRAPDQYRLSMEIPRKS